MAFYDITAILFLGLLLVPVGLFVITLISLTREEVRNPNATKPLPIPHQHTKTSTERTGLRLVK